MSHHFFVVALSIGKLSRLLSLLAYQNVNNSNQLYVSDGFIKTSVKRARQTLGLAFTTGLEISTSI